MLQQIVLNTPLWVWALLAFLVYRGIVAAGGREVPLKKTLIIPLVMFALSLHGTLSAFGLRLPTLAPWLACLAVGAVLAWRLFDHGAVQPHPRRGTVYLRGSWLPMALMLAIFATKYAVGVLLALQPQWALQTAFALGVCALYGLFSGIFIGKMLRILALYRAAVGAEAVPGFASSLAR
jgi:hypothetical protein